MFLYRVCLFRSALERLRRQLRQIQRLAECTFTQHGRARQIVVQLNDAPLVLKPREQTLRAAGTFSNRFS